MIQIFNNFDTPECYYFSANNSKLTKCLALLPPLNEPTRLHLWRYFLALMSLVGISSLVSISSQRKTHLFEIRAIFWTWILKIYPQKWLLCRGDLVRLIATRATLSPVLKYCVRQVKYLWEYILCVIQLTLKSISMNCGNDLEEGKRRESGSQTGLPNNIDALLSDYKFTDWCCDGRLLGPQTSYLHLISRW